MRMIAAVAVAAAVTVTVPGFAQEPPKPGPEHEVLTKLVGTWDITLKVGGMESKGTVVYKTDLGGLWVTSRLECDLLGQKFSGRGLDSYDAGKKKYVGVWVDSMSTTPLVMEGTYDAAKKTMTMIGDGPGPDGKPTKQKTVTVMPDADTLHFSMYTGDSTEPSFTAVYKRKK